MIRFGVTSIVIFFTLATANDLGYHPISKIGLIAAIILFFYIPKFSKFYFENCVVDEEAEERRLRITRKDPLKIEDTDDNLLQGYNFLWEDKKD